MSAQDIIRMLDLSPHPEGGWYRETWRAETGEGGRVAATTIWFLLEAGQASHWHRVDATEIWCWHAGASLRLLSAPRDEGPVEEVRLGGDVLAGQIPQYRIEPHHWQAAEADLGWALVSCIVVPGFEFSGFELAAKGWAPG